MCSKVALHKHEVKLDFIRLCELFISLRSHAISLSSFYLKNNSGIGITLKTDDTFFAEFSQGKRVNVHRENRRSVQPDQVLTHLARQRW